VPISASAFRFAIGRELGWNTLRSDRFDAHSAAGKISFDGRGSGHGVGLCQHGADEMGTEGRSYHDILAYYYPGTEIGSSARGFEWKRLAGQGVVLYTTRQDRDSALLTAAERDLHHWSDRTGWTLSRPIEIRVYPDVQGFRDATGEPGWVAAYAHGMRIEMQPASGAEYALRHEILHVFVESKAAPSLPLWFREGLVDYLSDAPAAHAGPVRFPSDQELRQTTDAAAARKAYADSSTAVADLASRHGEKTLFTWVTQGLPGALKNGAPRQAPQED
ncbi:MAG TPA: hypothetical protein VHW24_12010, partial [Bryobacteraceae bacterium]|nr:hypothetical protein [Bryobacteraceae bacterium]